eukprot:scaffold15119_cov63-Cyclotella_meneghiniana.AAC.5
MASVEWRERRLKSSAYMPVDWQSSPQHDACLSMPVVAGEKRGGYTTVDCDNQVIILILVRVYVKNGEKNTTACLRLPPNFDPATPACLGLGLQSQARNEPTTRLSTATVTTISNPWPGMAP